MDQYTITCAECGTTLDEIADGSPRQPCPKCGSRIRELSVEVEDEVEVHDMLELRSKKEGMSGLALRNHYGSDFSTSRQTWMEKIRIIDREHDRYFERVWDPATGEVVRDCEEPLSQHTGHGSAKSKTEG